MPQAALVRGGYCSRRDDCCCLTRPLMGKLLDPPKRRLSRLRRSARAGPKRLLAWGLLFWQRLRGLFNLWADAWSRLTERTVETITGIRVVKAFAQEHTEMAAFAVPNRRLRDVAVRAGVNEAVFFSTAKTSTCHCGLSQQDARGARGFCRSVEASVLPASASRTPCSGCFVFFYLISARP